MKLLFSAASFMFFLFSASTFASHIEFECGDDGGVAIISEGRVELDGKVPFVSLNKLPSAATYSGYTTKQVLSGSRTQILHLNKFTIELNTDYEKTNEVSMTVYVEGQGSMNCQKAEYIK